MKQTIRTVARKCTCRMTAGEAWAVRQIGILIGYYLACPICGRVNIILADELTLVEQPDPVLPRLVRISPAVTCSGCARAFRLTDSRFEEVARVERVG